MLIVKQLLNTSIFLRSRFPLTYTLTCLWCKPTLCLYQSGKQEAWSALLPHPRLPGARTVSVSMHKITRVWEFPHARKSSWICRAEAQTLIITCEYGNEQGYGHALEAVTRYSPVLMTLTRRWFMVNLAHYYLWCFIKMKTVELLSSSLYKFVAEWYNSKL